MTSIVTSTYNPRSYIYSSNSETLILHSAIEETRLSFINSSYPDGNFRYVFGASSDTLSVYSISNVAQSTFSSLANTLGLPQLRDSFFQNIIYILIAIIILVGILVYIQMVGPSGNNPLNLPPTKEIAIILQIVLPIMPK